MNNNQKLTTYQKLTRLFNSGLPVRSSFEIPQQDLITTKSKEEFEFLKLQAQQTKYVKDQWQKVENDLYQKSFNYQMSRIAVYSDAENMEAFPEISSALNLYSAEASTLNEDGKILQIYSDSERIKSILEDLFFNRLDLNSNLYSWARNLVKLGDNFLYIKNGGEKIGIVGTIQLPNIEIERIEGDTYGSVNEDKKHTKFLWRGKNREFNTWEIAHFRLLGKDSFLPYGTSLLSDARRYWRLLLMSEDAMCTYRVSRASERRVFKINVGNMSDEDVEAYINKIANKFKRQPIVDPKTGQVDVRFHNIDVTSDFFIPVRNDNAGTVIDTLPGACLSLDTKIPLLNGENISLNNLIQRWDEGERNFWVYSINPDNGDILPAPITWAGVTRKNTDVMKITLDNGEEIICTPDHKFPLESGKTVSKDIKVGDKILSYNEEFIYDRKNKEVIKIEYLEDKVDTGTITVDGDEIYSKHHTFALSSGVFTYNSNLDSIADIEYLQNKLLASMQIPKEFIGFDSSTGEGKNLSMMDIRFARNVNRVQQALVQELNKIAIIHLYLLGFEEELSNFSLRLNNPSTQAELLKLELYRERFGLYRDATAKMDNGFSMTSMTWAKKNILGMSDDEIKLDLQRQKIESVAAQELNNITGLKTGIFDDIDRLYKSVQGIQNPQPVEGSSGSGGGFGGGGFGGGDFTSSTDLGGEGGLEELGGEQPQTEPETGQEQVGEPTQEQPQEEEQTFPESIKKKNNLITEEINTMIKEINKFTK